MELSITRKTNLTCSLEVVLVACKLNLLASMHGQKKEKRWNFAKTGAFLLHNKLYFNKILKYSFKALWNTENSCSFVDHNFWRICIAALFSDSSDTTSKIYNSENIFLFFFFFC